MTSPVSTLVFALVGLLVSARRPQISIGWLLGELSILFGLTIVASVYEPLGDALGRTLPGTQFAVWMALWLWIPATVLPFSLLPLIFPDGRLPSPRWAPVAWILVVGTVLLVLGIAVHPQPNVSPTQTVNPYGLDGAAPALDVLANLGGILVIIGVVGSLAAVIVRRRRTQGAERRQGNWLLLALALGFATMALGSIWYARNPAHPIAFDLAVASVWVAIMLLGLGVGVAIIRFRRYDIDLILNRSLVYGTLSAAIVGLYVLLVTIFGVLIGSSGSLVLAALAAALGAVLLEPLRTRLQRLVNRWMYGARDDPYTILSILSQQMRFAVLPGAALTTLVETIGEALKLPYVALALPNGSATTIAASYGQPVADARQFPLIYHGETVGQLLVAPRLPGEAFGAGEARLLEDIALQAGAAAHVARLHSDLQRSRERLVTAREEERRRLRRDLHDGLGPQLASLTLTTAAIRELLHSDPAAAELLL
ncbi:MAG: histidine kinase, partial [Caldilineaceae bacterium]